MEIKYNESTNSIEIKDKLKRQLFLYKAMALCNILHGILQLVFVLDQRQLKMLGFIWIVISLFSLVAFLYFVFRKTAQNVINLANIIALEEKDLLGRRQYTLKLKNGKYRDLTNFRSRVQIIELTELFQQHGIPAS